MLKTTKKTTINLHKNDCYKIQKSGFRWGYCSHGKCIDHHFFKNYKTIKIEFKLKPNFFGKKTIWRAICCGKKMLRMVQINTCDCLFCGRESVEEGLLFGRCECCGNKQEAYKFAF